MHSQNLMSGKAVNSAATASGLALHKDVETVLLDYTASSWVECVVIHTADLQHLIKDFWNATVSVSAHAMMRCHRLWYSYLLPLGMEL